MREIERDWINWFADEYKRRSLEDRKTPLTERVPWSLIEDKGIELKIVRMNEPGWYDALKVRWANLFPTAWCEKVDTALRKNQALPLGPFEQEQKPRPVPVRPYEYYEESRTPPKPRPFYTGSRSGLTESSDDSPYWLRFRDKDR